MLNKRIELLISVLMASTLMLGCSNKNKVVEENTNEVIHETVEETVEEEFIDEFAYETIDEKFERLQSMLEEVFKKHNIEYELGHNGIDSYTALGDGRLFRFAYYKSQDIYNPAISVLGYIDEDVERIKENGFKMEESLLGDIAKVLIKDGIDYSSVNEQVTDGIVNGAWCIINNQYGKIREHIGIESPSEPNRLTFSYTIKFDN